MALLTRYLFELRVVEYFFRDNFEIDSNVFDICKRFSPENIFNKYIIK